MLESSEPVRERGDGLRTVVSSLGMRIGRRTEDPLGYF